jgi:hypothetical protein
VWWGWWRKETETDIQPNLKGLGVQARLERLNVVLIDTSAERMHTAEADDVRQELPKGERAHVPEYYRHQAKVVYAWFRLIKITPDVPYDSHIEKLIGNRTFAMERSL